MKMKVLALVFAFAATVALADVKSYKGFTVLRTDKLTKFQSDELNKLEQLEVFSYWKSPRSGSSADLMVSQENQEALKKHLEDFNVSFETMVPDVDELIKSSDKVMSFNKVHRKMDWNNYYDHNAINAYVDELASTYPFVHSVSIGKTYEGRDMRVLQILKAGEGKPNVFIEAGIHAREWIAPAMATYIMRELVERNASQYLDNLNIHIIPSANPDGYEFSRDSDRLWRKTRSTTGSIIGCKGVDGNRNWDIAFAETGASDSKCAETYHGPEAFSEVEMANIRDYVLKLEPTPILALCLHSYSQLWMYPYGYKYNTYPTNVEEIKALGEKAVAALKAVHGTVFDPINSADLYPASGASDDWYKAVLNARFTYTVELRDTGKNGFILPANQIIPSGEELWAGLQVVLDEMVNLSS